MRSTRFTNNDSSAGIRPRVYKAVMGVNWLALFLCYIPLAFYQPDVRAAVIGGILVLPVVLARSGLIRGHWSEMFIHLGMSFSVMVAFFLHWAPPIVVLLFVATGMLSLVFLTRPWGGWYFSLMAVAVTIPIAMSMMGYGNEFIFTVEHNFAVIAATAIMVGINGFIIARQNRWSVRETYRARHLVTRMQEVHFQFADVIAHAPTLDETLWEVVDLCIPALELEDCVIYLLNNENQMLEQVAAYGPKSRSRGNILSPIKLEMGQGIVGKAALSQEAVLVGDLTKMPDYVVDDIQRKSELAVPIFFEGRVVGVIDSEHSEKHYFTDDHVILFQMIATLCTNKITELQLIDSKLEKASAERELSQINQVEELRNTFLNNLSHDLRTPLSLIKGPLQELMGQGNPEGRKLAEVAMRNADRLNEMVSGLLNMHKLERGALHPKPVLADISARLRELHALFIHEAERRQIKYALHMVDLEPVMCDSSKIGQVVQNLLSNAFKFTPDKGTIQLKGSWRDGKLNLSVEDSGIGIPEDQRQKVFERFYKIDSDSHIEGTGLGLAMVKEFVELLDGKVSLGKSTLGGARFEVILPADLPAESEAELNGTVLFSQSRPLVVVVEDHPEMNEFISGLLHEEYEVRTAFNAEEGWELIENYLPELIITDLMLPGMSGEMLCKRIKTSVATDHLPVLALSAKQSTDTKIELYNYGADNYLTKPFDSEELRSVVRGLINQRSKLKAKFGNGVASAGEQSKGMRKIEEFIRSEIANSNFGPRDLEKAIGINRNQLQRKIKAVTGFTPVEYIRVMRLENARNLLKQGDNNVSDAAYASGFNQLAYFSKAYKAHFGTLPSDDLVREESR